jgi:hypothetical protein
MTERALRLSHVVVRIISTINIVFLGFSAVCTRYFPSLDHAMVNDPLGIIMLFWTMITSLLLPLCVGFEAWWTLKLKLKSNALAIDAALTLMCFALLLGMALYGFTHYAMF